MTDTTNKIYTILAFFAVGDGERDECWVANFKNRGDAEEAFRIKLREVGCKRTDTKKLFQVLVTNGNAFVTKDTTMWFVRNQPVITEINDESRDFISWE